MPLQLIIIGMPQLIIFIIKSQQFLNMSMFMPSGQLSLQVIVPSALISQLILAIIGIIMGIIIGICVPIGMGICMAGIITAFSK